MQTYSTAFKKVLIISYEFPPGPGGIGNHAFNLACQLAKHEYDINVITESDNASNLEIENFDRLISSFNINRIKRFGILTYIRRLIKYLQEFRKADLLIVSGKFPVWSVNLLRLFSSKNCITSVIHGSEIRLPEYWQRKLFNTGLKKSNDIISVSSFSRSLLPKELQHKTIVIPNGVNFSHNELSKKKDHHEFPDGNKRLFLLTVGNVTQRKGQHRVIKALPSIIDNFPQTVYHMAGIPTNQSTIIELAKEIKVDAHFKIHGKVSDEELNELYKAADVLLMLSDNQIDGDVEGFGIAILEANCYGIPAI